MENTELVENPLAKEENTPEEKLPYIVIQRIVPDAPTPTDPDDNEGVVLTLTKEGRLDARILREFIDHYEVSRFPDKKTVAVTAVLKCGYNIPAILSAPTVEMYEEDGMVAECQGKIAQQLATNLEFVWALATSCQSRIKAEQQAE